MGENNLPTFSATMNHFLSFALSLPLHYPTIGTVINEFLLFGRFIEEY